MGTTERLNALLAAAEKATPGPWIASGRGVEFDEGELLCLVNLALPVDMAHATAKHIAACSPEVVIALCRVALAAQGDRGIINPSKLYDALAALEAAK